MMTRKDYVATAEILKTYVGKVNLDVLEDLADNFSMMFEADNQRFDSDKFFEAIFKELEDVLK